MFQLMERYGQKGDVLIGAGTYFMIAKEDCDSIGDNFQDGTHSNEFETSLTMHVRPDLVHVDRLGDWEYKPKLILSFQHEITSVNRLPDSSHHIGVCGDPRRADSEKGRAYSKACVTKVAEVVENFGPEYFGLKEGF